MKAREFERFLREQGATLEKNDADHHIWKLANGEKLIVPVGGKHTEAKSYLMSKYRRLMRRSA